MQIEFNESDNALIPFSEKNHIVAVLAGKKHHCHCLDRVMNFQKQYKPQGLYWTLRTRPGYPALVAPILGSYDGDETGREWQNHYAIYYLPASEAFDNVASYEVYNDDGEGNGNFLGAYSTLDEAVFNCESGNL